MASAGEKRLDDKDSKTDTQFAVGDQVRIISDVERVKFLQKGHGGWNDLMSMCLGETCRIVNINSDNDLKVNIGGIPWTFNPEAVTKVASRTEDHFTVGDFVRINSDIERVKELQQGHGGWNEHMSQIIGKIGCIKIIDSDKDVWVEIDGRPWPINPEAVTKVASTTETKLAVGDLVKISSNIERVKVLQNGHGGWDDRMRLFIGDNGSIKKIEPDGDLIVDFGVAAFLFHPEAIDKVATPEEIMSGLMKILNEIDLAGDINGELVKASAEGDVIKVEELLKREKSDVNGDFAGHTALQVASRKGNCDVIRVLIKYNVNIETEDTEGNRAVHNAALGNMPEVIKLLSEGGASLNVKTKKKLTPLHIAVNNDHIAVVRVLLELGCTPHVQDIEGDTPLHNAISKENIDILSLLLEHNSDMFTTNTNGFNAIQHAAYRGKPQALRILLNKLPRQRIVDEKKDDGFTALHIASCNNYIEVAELLINQGKASVDIQNVKLQTPLHLAVMDQSTQIISLLVNAGCKLNTQDKDGDTPLHCVIMKFTQPQQHADICRLLGLAIPVYKDSCKSIACFLAAKGADLKLKNKRDKTPLDLCQDTDLRESVIKSHQENTSPPLIAPQHIVQNDQSTAEAGGSDTVSQLAVGNLVQICSDPERVKHLQEGHGEWIDPMITTLGTIGRVKRIFPNNDVKVKTRGGYWRYNSQAVTKVSPDSNAGESSSGDSDDESFSDLLKMLTGTIVVGGNKNQLFKAAEKGDAEEAEKILKEGKSDVNGKCAGSTALHAASYHGHTEVIKVLKKYNVKIEKKDTDGDTAVHNAAFGDKPEVIKLLHELGADLNARNKRGITSLHLGVNKNSTEVVKTLLELGCHPNLQDQEGDTALHDATGKKRDDMVSLLLEHNADVTIINNKGFNTLHLAAFRGYPDIMRIILTKLPHSWIVDEKKEDGFTPLHLAALNNHAEVVELLVDQGKANLDIQNDLLQTPLHLSVTKQHHEVIRFLVKKGCALNIRDKYGDTPLHDVMKQLKKPTREQPSIGVFERLLLGLIPLGIDKNSCGSIACFLAANGANVHLKNTKGESPLDLCNDSFLCAAVVRSHIEKIDQSLTEIPAATQSVDMESMGESLICSGQISEISPSTSKQIETQIESGAESQNPTMISNETREDSRDMQKLQQELLDIKDQTRCPICLERQKNMIFLCGHGTCQQCGDRVNECPICRKSVEKKILLY